MNGGGVVVSYFEWVKNISHIRFEEFDKKVSRTKNIRFNRSIGQMDKAKIYELIKS